ncbi:hypothetical protein [Streptomyces sp. NPDC058694]
MSEGTGEIRQPDKARVDSRGQERSCGGASLNIVQGCINSQRRPA